jgi:hypothetical protein
MGHFTINLPDNKQGDVRWGKVKKLEMNLNVFSRSKPKNEPKTGYLVKIAPNAEHRLFKSKNGEWTKDVDGKIALNDEPLISIKKAIIEKEKELSDL